MKRLELSLAVLGLILVAWGGTWIRAGRGPVRDAILDGGPACPAAPVRILEPSGPPRGSVIIFHGLGANRIVMLTNGQQFAAAGFRVFLPDGPGHGDDTAPFSLAANESCARGLLAALERRGEITPQRTVLLGHSLGAAVAVRLADDFLAAATIAVATAPLIPPHRIPANLLLVAPQFDMPPVRDTESRLAAAAGTDRATPEDFRQFRAFRLLPVPWRSHTSALFDPAAARAMLRWALDAVGATGVPVPTPSYRAFTGGWLGLLGILLLFPTTASVVTRAAGIREPHPRMPPPQRVFSLLAWIAALIPAAIISAPWTPLASLRLYGADYLAAVLLLAGIPLAIGYGGYAAHQRRTDSSRRSSSSPISGPICAIIVGLLTILAIGAWLNLQLTEAWPIPARWALFPFLFLALLPISFAEELSLGDPAALRPLSRVERIAFFFLLRAIVWLVLLGALLLGVSSALLPTILGAYFLILSIGQRLGADALRHRTGSALAAAFFSAILGAWFLAAVFPFA